MLPHMYPIHSIIGEYIPSGQGGKLTVFVIQVDEQNITSTIVTIETSRIVTKMHTILHSIYEWIVDNDETMARIYQLSKNTQ